jgi:hypothetical protein
VLVDLGQRAVWHPRVGCLRLYRVEQTLNHPEAVIAQLFGPLGNFEK